MGSTRLLLFVFGVLKLPVGKMFGSFDPPVPTENSVPSQMQNTSIWRQISKAPRKGSAYAELTSANNDCEEFQACGCLPSQLSV